MESFIGDLVPIIGIVATFGAPTAIIITLAILRHRQRMELVRQGINPDRGIPAYPNQRSLFLGLLLLGIGLAMLVMTIPVVLSAENMRWWENSHMLLPGLLLTGAGIAFLVYWKLTAPDRERVKRLFEERYAAGAFEPQPPARKEGVEMVVPAPASETPDTAG